MPERIESSLQLNDAFSTTLQKFMQMVTTAQQPLQRLTGLLDQFGRPLQAAQSPAEQVKSSGTAASQAAGGFLGLTNGLLGAAKAYVGVGAAIAATKMIMLDGIRAAMQEEMQVIALTSALQRLGQPVDISAALGYIDQLSEHLGVADDEFRAVALTLARTGDISAAGIMRLLPAMAGFKAEGKSMEQVAHAIALGLQGNARGLREFGIAIEDGASKAELLEVIKARFASMGKVAEDSANSSAGALRKMFVAWDESKESFGAGFLATFGGTADGIKSMGELLKGLGREIGVLLRGALLFFETVTVGVKFIWGVISSALGYVVAAVTAGIRGIINSFDAIKAVVVGVGEVISAALTGAMLKAELGIKKALDWIIEKYNAVVEFFGGTPIAFTFDTEATDQAIKENATKIDAALGKIGAAGAKVGSAFGDAFSEEFGMVNQYVKDQLDGLTRSSLALWNAVGIKTGSNATPNAPAGGDDLTDAAKAADAQRRAEQIADRQKAVAEEIKDRQIEGAKAVEAAAKRIADSLQPLRDALNEPRTKAEGRARERDKQREQDARRQQANLLAQSQAAADAGDKEKAADYAQRASDYGAQADKYAARQQPGNKLNRYQQRLTDDATRQIKSDTNAAIVVDMMQSGLDVGDGPAGTAKAKDKSGKGGKNDVSAVTAAAKDTVSELKQLAVAIKKGFTDMTGEISSLRKMVEALA